MILYKYSSFDNALISLKERTIKITPPIDLNDAYEMNYQISLSQERLVNAFLEGAYPGMDKLLEVEGYELNSENRIKFYQSRKDQLEPAFNELRRKLLDNYRVIFDKMYDSLAIFSLSADPGNTLMWSHYGSSYKGLCLGYDFIDIENFDEPYRVLYKKKRPFFNADQISDGNHAAVNDFIIDLVRTKGKEWKYEKEYRFVFQMDEDELEKHRNGKIITLTISKDSIREVIISPKIEENMIIKLLEVITKKENSHIKLYGIYYSEDGAYSLSRKEIGKDILSVKKYLLESFNEYSEELLESLSRNFIKSV